MFTSTFRAPSLPVPLPQTANPSSNYPYIMDHHHHDDHYLNILDFDYSDYLSLLIDQPDQDSSSNFNFNSSSSLSNPTTPILQDMATNSTESSDSSINVCMPRTTTPMQLYLDELKRGNKVHGGRRIAFRMKTELEIVDDGYKWRKYGKKKVKSSPYPRNYYRCSSGGCIVKKRVERDRDDWSYVITTYEGVHNHESPSLIHCNTDVLPSGGWTSRSLSYI